MRYLALVSLIVAATALAQSETPPASTAQAQTPQTPEYSEAIEVRAIDVDVIVTDRHGRPIPGLKRDDFELYENGKRVDIDYFSGIAGGHLVPEIPEVPVAEAGTPTPTTEPRVPMTWVVFVDQTNLVPQRRNYAMQQLQDFLEHSVGQGDHGLIALNDGRSFRIRQQLTDDPRLLMDTLAKMMRERMAVSPTKNQATLLLSEMRRNDQDFGAPPSQGRFIAQDQTEVMAEAAGGQIIALIQQEAGRTKAAILAMESLLDAVGQIPGRMALVYVGAGFNTHPGADLTAVWRSRFAQFIGASFEPKPEDEGDRIEREITSLYDNLSALRVAVYAIQAGDPGGGPTSVEDRGITGTGAELNKVTSSEIESLTETSYAQEMAHRTGGLFFKTTPGLSNQLTAMARDFEDYYSLGYRPTGPPGDIRQVRVKVNVDGARVRYRQVVREQTESTRAAGQVVQSMVPVGPPVVQRIQRGQPVVTPTVTTAANPLGVSVKADRPTTVGFDGPKFLTFNFSIDLGTLKFVKEEKGLRADFVMHFALVGKDGTVYPLESREQSLTVPKSDLSMETDAIAYAWHVDLAPLKLPDDIPAYQKGMSLIVTVEDQTSGLRSVVSVPVGADEEGHI